MRRVRHHRKNITTRGNLPQELQLEDNTVQKIRKGVRVSHKMMVYMHCARLFVYNQ